jgi:hypothetical protein
LTSANIAAILLFMSKQLITPDNKKPIIINKVGLYEMASGQQAEIFEIQDHSDNLTVTRFNCKGHKLRRTPTGRIKKDFDTWHQSGYAGFQRDSDHIIKKLS